MTRRLIRPARRTVGFIGLALLLVLMAFSIVTHAAPLTGRDLFIIGGGSMEPSIPIGSMVIVTRVDPLVVEVGDAITVRAANGIVVTHRVSRIVDRPEGRSFELKGDANRSPDAGLVPAGELVGAADRFVPYAGFVQQFLTTRAGVVATLSLLGALLLLYLLLEMLGSGQPTVAEAVAPTEP